MNNYVYIKVINYQDRFIRKCYEQHISLHEINYLNKDEMIVKINLKDYKKVKKYNYYSKILIVKYDGLKGVRLHIRKFFFTYVMIILSMALMDVITSYIVKIDIIHENSEIRKLIKKELESFDIKELYLAKDFDELEAIKNKILENNQTKLEWMSITRFGMKYVVRVEERIITEIQEETGYAHLISSKDALVTKITYTSGDALVRSGDYVKKGDILISGELKLNEEVKDNTLAHGEVYGNVWYTSEISIPLEYEEVRETGRKRFNFSINNKIFFRNKYEHFKQTKVRKLSILGIKISYYYEVEYELITGKYTHKEAEEIALDRLHESILNKLSDEEMIIDKKVLKKEEINSTINISVFIIVNELISQRLYYTPGSDENDSSNSD